MTDLLLKNVKFSWKSWNFFLFWDLIILLKKICQFLHENLKVLTGKSKSSNIPAKTVRFFYKNVKMFHVFAFAYFTSGFLWPILTIFPLFCKMRARTVMRACTLYHCACMAQVHSHLVSSNYLQIREVKRYMKYVPLSGRVTGIFF